MASKYQKSFFALPECDLAHVVEYAGDDLKALRGGKIFLTGGTGFFGRWIVGALLHASSQLDLALDLTVLSRDPGRFCAAHPEIENLPGLHFITGDVTDFSVEGSYDCLIHAATDTLGISAAQEEERSRAIIAGTERMLALARKGGRMLNVSSGGVYGAATSRLSGAVEDDAAQPVTAYGRAKLEAEKRCVDSGFEVVTARAFAFLGPHLALDAHYAAGNFLRDAARGGPVVVRGDGTALRSYLYPADLVVWLVALLVRGKAGRAYNVGSDEVVSTAQLARLIAGELEVTIESSQLPGPQNIYLPNIRRAKTELDLEVTIPLREAVARTLEFLRT